MSEWGREFMWPDDGGDDTILGWLSREAVPSESEARALAADELLEPPESLALTPVLMRVESEVEAKINGHEAPLWVECTSRAKKAEPFWRVVSRG
jgi:hypothetical protein